MNTYEFISLRGQYAIDNIDDKAVRTQLKAPAFNKRNMAAWLHCAVEPWRLYGAKRPNDLPPKGGDPRLLARLRADPDYGWEPVHD